MGENLMQLKKGSIRGISGWWVVNRLWQVEEHIVLDSYLLEIDLGSPHQTLIYLYDF